MMNSRITLQRSWASIRAHISIVRLAFAKVSRSRLKQGSLLLAVLLTLLALSTPSVPTVRATTTRLDAHWGEMPLYFIANQGQLGSRVEYYVQGSDKTLYFTPEGVTFALTNLTTSTTLSAGPSPLSSDERGEGRGRWIVKLDFVDANSVRPSGQAQAEAIISYSKGSPDEWHIHLPTSAQSSGTIERIAVASDGTQGDGWSMAPSISADGRFVAFESFASNLVPGDTILSLDIFVRDRQSSTTERISVASDGTPGNNVSSSPSISADGRFVAFESGADNLAVPCNTMGNTHLFVRDRQARTTECISLASDGTPGNWGAQTPSISADGRFVAFDSYSNNLVPGDTNLSHDIFVRDRQNGTTERISVASDGTQSNYDSFVPSISADGRFVAFESGATNLVPGYNNGYFHIYVRDRQAGTTERVSVASNGTQGNWGSYNPSISANGRFVAFNSLATNLVAGYEWLVQGEIYVRDRQSGTTEIASLTSDGARVYGGDSYRSSISADGRFVAFQSMAYTLVPGGTNGRRDCYLRDRQTGTTERLSVASDGTQANDSSGNLSISADGRFVAFESRASNLVPGDTNEEIEVFSAKVSASVTPASFYVYLPLVLRH